MDVARCLLAAGADLNKVDENGRTAMYAAALNGHQDCQTRHKHRRPFLVVGLKIDSTGLGGFYGHLPGSSIVPKATYGHKPLSGWATLY